MFFPGDNNLGWHSGKNPPVNAGDTRALVPILGWEDPWRGNGDCGLRSLAFGCVPHYSCPILLMMEGQLFNSEPLLFLGVLSKQRVKELPLALVPTQGYTSIQYAL